MRICRYFFVYLFVLLVFLQAPLLAEASSIGLVDTAAEQDGSEEEDTAVDQDGSEEEDTVVEQDGSEEEEAAAEQDGSEEEDAAIDQGDSLELDFVISLLKDVDSLDEVMVMYMVSLLAGFGLNSLIALCGIAVGSFRQIFSFALDYYERG